MTEHLAENELRHAMAGGVEAARRAIHLASCPACRERAHQLAGVAERVVGLRDDLATPREIAGGDEGHLSYGTLEAWADGTLDAVESELVMSHLVDCPRCRRECDDLRQFVAEHERAQRQPEPRATRRFALAAVLALTSVGGALLLRHSAIPRDSAPPELEIRPPADSVSAEPVVLSSRRLLHDASGPIERSADGTLTGIPSAEAPEVELLLRGATLAKPPILTDLAAEGGQLRSTGHADPTDGPDVVVQSPMAEVVVDPRPRFTWQGPDGGYRVEIFDVELSRVQATGVQVANSWKPDSPLLAGTYYWQLRALDAPGAPTYPQPPEPPATFHVLGEVARAEIAHARASGSHLILGVVLARHGVTAEALVELEALVGLNPGAELPQRLLAQIAAWSPDS